MSTRKLFSLVFIKDNRQLLLGLKKRGFGKGKWNGFGGKVEPGESITTAAIREVKEECGLKISNNDIVNIGRLEFTFDDQPVLMDVVVYLTSKFEGTPEESEEMLPKWFDVDEIPFEHMWLDDKLWFPYLLSGKFFSGKFHYSGHDVILNYDLQESLKPLS